MDVDSLWKCLRIIHQLEAASMEPRPDGRG